MSNQRYDIEWALPPIVAAYLTAELTLQFPKLADVSPVITIFDPMAIDEANRVIVEVPGGKTMKEQQGSFSGSCLVTVKSRWAQPSVAADMSAHFNRTNWTRDALMSPTIAADLNALALTMATAAGKSSAGLNVDFVQPVIEFKLDVRSGWVYSETTFQFNGCFIP